MDVAREVRVVRLDPSGDLSVEVMDQARVHERLPGKQISFVGAIPELDLLIVAAPSMMESPVRPTFMARFVHEPINGAMYFIGTDEHGGAKDVDVDAVGSWVAQRKAAAQ